jgi:hypothetical protein
MQLSDKLERYMLDLGLSYEDQGDNVWIVVGTEKGTENIIVVLEEPIVIVRTKVMDVPASQKAELCETLLKLNATDVIHGAYALEGDSVILMNTLVAETMDIEEFQATLDAIGLALVQHYEILAKYRSGPGK